MLCSLYACVWYYQTIHVHVYIIEINVVCCVGRVEIEIEITFRALALRQRETNFSDEGPMLETLDYTIRIGSTLTILYFDLYPYSAYAARYVYFNFGFFNFGSFTAATLCLISRRFVTVSITKWLVICFRF